MNRYHAGSIGAACWAAIITQNAAWVLAAAIVAPLAIVCAEWWEKACKEAERGGPTT